MGMQILNIERQKALIFIGPCWKKPIPLQHLALSAMHLEGGCLCGSVRYVVNGMPVAEESPCLCHCRICQRASGAPVVAWATFPMVDVTLLFWTPE